ncbi:FAD/NAD(P)-binding protein [Bradyrhizobium tropiciagri]|uniref:FAD/NAD(P)-binding protein n=1 Tax=Bradyrhizobium tropiciagri TaxID=312253 RepID=UPI000AB2B8F7
MIDGLRPYTQRLWHELPQASKRRFLEHARAWWDVHRHRMAPEVEARVSQAIYAGQLSLLAAKVISVAPTDDGARIHYRRRGDTRILNMQVGAVVDCTGIVKDPRATPNPAIRGLFERGLARVDPLCIGIETDRNCAIIGRDGEVSQRLFAVGPLTRAAFWEIIAIPDIRNQCAALAARLTEPAGSRRAELERVRP